MIDVYLYGLVRLFYMFNIWNSFIIYMHFRGIDDIRVRKGHMII